MRRAARVGDVVTHDRTRAALSHPAFCGLDRAHLNVLIEELADPWTTRCASALHERRGGDRRRAAGAGPDHELVFTDRVLVTAVYLRLQLPHAALAELYGVTRPTVTRAIHEIRPLLAARGFAVPDQPGIRHGPRPRPDPVRPCRCTLSSSAPSTRRAEPREKSREHPGRSPAASFTAASKVRRVCPTASTLVSCSRTRLSFGPERNGRGCDLEAALTPPAPRLPPGRHRRRRRLPPRRTPVPHPPPHQGPSQPAWPMSSSAGRGLGRQFGETVAVLPREAAEVRDAPAMGDRAHGVARGEDVRADPVEP